MGFHHPFGQSPPCVDAFTAMQADFLEYMRTNGFVYSRKEARLELPTDELKDTRIHRRPISASGMSRILSNCSSLEVFCWKSVLESDTAALLAGKCAGTLKSLTVNAEVPVLATFLKRCGGLLTYLDLCAFVCPLLLIASACPQVISLSLVIGDRCKQEDFSALFTTCAHLKELSWSFITAPRFSMEKWF